MSSSEQGIIGPTTPGSQQGQGNEYDGSNLYYKLQQSGYTYPAILGEDPGVIQDISNSIPNRSRAVSRGFSFKSHSELRDSEGGSVVTNSGVTLDRQQTQILGPKRPKPHKVWRKRYVKILVVGDSGLGKTTLVRTLLSVPGESMQLHDGSGTSLEQFVKRPSSLCSSLSWKDEDDKIEWVYQIQDTPGFGDMWSIQKHIDTIIQHVIAQNQKWLDIEMHARRNQDLNLIVDPRVDICIFCLPPHRVRAQDLRYMYALGKVVPIVPVVTKADSMTMLEAQQYRQEVYNSIKGAKRLPGVHGPINLFEFESETLERCNIAQLHGKHNMPPFLVIGSNEINEDMQHQEPPVFWPQRTYQWGTSEAFNPDHSDLIYLRLLLLKEGAEEISMTTKSRYEEWRQQTLTRIQWGHKIRGAVLNVCSIAGIGMLVLVAASKGNVGEAFGRLDGFRKKILKKNVAKLEVVEKIPAKKWWG